MLLEVKIVINFSGMENRDWSKNGVKIGFLDGSNILFFDLGFSCIGGFGL